jgi:putative addiction module killer protein
MPTTNNQELEEPEAAPSLPRAERYPFNHLVANGRSHMSDWFGDLDGQLQSIVNKRLERISPEAVKKLKPLQADGDLFEIRFKSGGGLRIYVGHDNGEYILICGGKKDTQFFDILKAVRLWSLHRKDSGQTTLREFEP